MSTHDASWVLRLYKLLKPDIGIRFVIKWQAMEVHTISTRQISNMFRRAFVHIYSLCCFSLFRLSYFQTGKSQGEPREHPSITNDTPYHFEVFCDKAAFLEAPNSWAIGFSIIVYITCAESRVDNSLQCDLKSLVVLRMRTAAAPLSRCPGSRRNLERSASSSLQPLWKSPRRNCPHQLPSPVAVSNHSH